MHTIDEFLLTDCRLLKPLPIFIGIYTATSGDPCTTGCAYFEGGNCPDYRKLNTPAKKQVQQPQETVRETAIRLGISISEVRRRRQKS
jgi:hypothetical protein